jgi:hypothetical protein
MLVARNLLQKALLEVSSGDDTLTRLVGSRRPLEVG